MKKYLAYASIVLSVLLARLVPFHWIVGSSCSSFSWSTMIAPIISKYAGLSWLGLFLIPLKTINSLTLCMFALHRVPLLGAACAYKHRHAALWIAAPLVCMVLFMVHPIGIEAWPYAMYWLIPMIVYFMHDTIWSRAIGASFVAHAIGSVIWLYTVHIPVAVWYRLLPIVIIERLCMASGMVACDRAFALYQEICQPTMQRLRRAGWL